MHRRIEHLEDRRLGEVLPALGDLDEDALARQAAGHEGDPTVIVPSEAVPYFRITTGAAAPIRMSRVSLSVFDMDTESHRGRG